MNANRNKWNEGNRTCGNCRHWKKIKGGVETDKWAGVGRCHFEIELVGKLPIPVVRKFDYLPTMNVDSEVAQKCEAFEWKESNKNHRIGIVRRKKSEQPKQEQPAAAQ